MKISDFEKNASKLIDKYVLEDRRKEGKLKGRFRASEITSCPRCMLFSMLNLPDNLYPKNQHDTAAGYKLMRRGTAIHEIVQEYLQGVGVLKKEDTEKVIKDDEYLFSGHCDGVLTFDDEKVLLEIKTINSEGFKNITQPKEDHFYQGQAYTYFLGKMFNYNIKKILFLYVDRGSDKIDMKEFWVQRDENVINMILNKLKSLKGYFERGELCPTPVGLFADKPPHSWSVYCTPQLCLSDKMKFTDFPGARIIRDGKEIVIK